MDTRTLVATFNDYSSARQAARELEDNGVSSDAIHVDSNQKTAGAGTTGYQEEEHHKEGGFTGWWNSLFGSDTDDHERRSYEGALEGGRSILRATVPMDTVDSAAAILNRYGAIDVQRPSGAGTESTYDSGTVRDRTGVRSGIQANPQINNGPIEVVEEELQVGKRSVQRGGVRVYSHVVTQPVEEQVRLREEHVNVERRPVNREINPNDLNNLKDQTIEVTEMAEEPVVAKRARVREEVVVGKDATERTETIRDSVRHTEVNVEQLGSNTGLAGNRDQDIYNPDIRDTDEHITDAPRTTGIRATGMSPNRPSQNVMSGFGNTAGAGTLAGEGTTGRSTYDFSTDYRKDFEQNYGTKSGANFETMQPAYDYGYRSAGDTTYQGRSWEDAQNTLRADYERRYPGSRWDEVKDAVRYGWDKVAGRR